MDKMEDKAKIGLSRKTMAMLWIRLGSKILKRFFHRHLTPNKLLEESMSGLHVRGNGFQLHFPEFFEPELNAVCGRDRTNSEYGDPDTTRGEFRHMTNSKRGGQFMRRRKGKTSPHHHGEAELNSLKCGGKPSRLGENTIRTASGVLYCITSK